MVEERTLKRIAFPVPVSIEEAADFIAKIGSHQRRLALLQAEVNDKIETLKAESIETAKPHSEAISQLFEAVYLFAQSRRGELTEEGKKKTVRLPTGEFFWRTNPPSVAISNVEKVIALCEKTGLARFIRIKKEPNKEAMLEEPKVAENIKGVTIRRDIEEFGVKPSETNIEVAKKTTKIPKKK